MRPRRVRRVGRRRPLRGAVIALDVALRIIRRRAAAAGVELILPGDPRREAIVSLVALTTTARWLLPGRDPVSHDADEDARAEATATARAASHETAPASAKTSAAVTLAQAARMFLAPLARCGSAS